mgnify:CR=1 FL=1
MLPRLLHVVFRRGVLVQNPREHGVLRDVVEGATAEAIQQGEILEVGHPALHPRIVQLHPLREHSGRFAELLHGDSRGKVHRDLVVDVVAHWLVVTRIARPDLGGEGDVERVREAVLLVEELEGALLAVVGAFEEPRDGVEVDLREVGHRAAGVERRRELALVGVAEEEERALRQRERALEDAVDADLPCLVLRDDGLDGMQRGGAERETDEASSPHRHDLLQ